MKKFFLLCAFFSFLTSAFAGTEVRNGGFVSFCQTFAGPEGDKTFYVLDIAEHPLVNYYYDDAEFAAAQKRAFEAKSPISVGQSLLNIIRKVDFESTNFHKILYRNHFKLFENFQFVDKLEHTRQDFGTFKPFLKDCEEPIQIAQTSWNESVDNPRFVLKVVGKYWMQLSDVNKAALILHENIYYYFKKYHRETDSQFSRKIVAKMLSPTFTGDFLDLGIQNADWP